MTGKRCINEATPGSENIETVETNSKES